MLRFMVLIAWAASFTQISCSANAGQEHGPDTVSVTNPAYVEPPLAHELKPFAWLVGDWNAQEPPELLQEGWNYRIGSQLRVRPSGDGSQLEIGYSHAKTHPMIFAAGCEVVETLCWDDAQQLFRLDTTFSKSPRRMSRFLKPTRDGVWREVRPPGAQLPMAIVRTKDGLVRQGFADAQFGPRGTESPIMGDRLRLEFRKSQQESP